MTEYKVTWKSQFDHIRMLIIFTFICYLILKAGVYFWGKDTLEAGLIAGGAWYLAFNFIPQAILHLRYLYLNHGLVMLFIPENRKIRITKGAKSECFSVDDILLMENCKSPPYFDNRRSVLPFDRYCYNVIYLKNGHHFVITSLMAEELDLPILPEKEEFKKVLFAYPAF